MIARLGIFNSLSGEEWLDNVKIRVAPATRHMRGYLGGFWLQNPDTGKVISLSFWESEDALRSNAPLRNIPLKPGQDPSRIPSPDLQEFYELLPTSI
jgi:Antibiotic biosynthesis monooxygenase